MTVRGGGGGETFFLSSGRARNSQISGLGFLFLRTNNMPQVSNSPPLKGTVYKCSLFEDEVEITEIHYGLQMD